MLINALMKYAENNLKDVCFTLPTTMINYRIIISDNGELLDIVEFNKDVIYPTSPTGRTNGLKSCVLDCNAKYIFGICFDKKSKTVKLEDRGCNNVFKQIQTDFFSSLDSAKCKAFRNFVETWNPEMQITNPIIDKIKTSLGKNFAFSLNTLDNYIETDEAFINKYINIGNISDRTNVCSITGKMGNYAELHNKIRLPGCSMGGSPLITFHNSTTSESYNNKEKDSAKSYITSDTMDIYTYTLNKLLNSETNHINIWNKDSNITFLYFTTSSKYDTLCNSIMATLLSSNNNTITDNTLNSVMEKVKHIESIDLSDVDINLIDFYLFELNPNAQANKSRISVKNQYHNSFGNVVNNINSFINRFKINDDTKPIKIIDIIRATLPYNTNKYKEYRDSAEYIRYYTDFVNIALNNKQILSNIFQNVIRECKRDFKIDGGYGTSLYIKNIRYRIIKAFINFKYNKEVIDMALQVNSDDFKLPFILGELFALYEHKQKIAQPNINNTLGMMYFNRAVESPNYIIAELHKKTIIYDNKIEGGLRYWINDLISKQIDKIHNELEKGGVIPNKFNLEEQSCFVLGYEKMKTHLYTKKEDKIDDVNTNINNNDS